MSTDDFSFAANAADFNQHIRASIPDYESLFEKCISLSRRFIQPDTIVLDMGCSTGALLSSIRTRMRHSRRGVQYLGIDVEPEFVAYWQERSGRDIQFKLSDVRAIDRFSNVSFACSLFTVQFIPAKDKVLLLKSLYEGLVDGGSFLIAEKIFAATARLQDALTYPYYDFKLNQGFTAAEVLDKERSLRGQMTLWTRSELDTALRDVGFRELETIWESFPFTAVLAVK